MTIVGLSQHWLWTGKESYLRKIVSSRSLEVTPDFECSFCSLYESLYHFPFPVDLTGPFSDWITISSMPVVLGGQFGWWRIRPIFSQVIASISVNLVEVDSKSSLWDENMSTEDFSVAGYWSCRGLSIMSGWSSKISFSNRTFREGS
jgi:hypothetical protein